MSEPFKKWSVLPFVAIVFAAWVWQRVASSTNDALWVWLVSALVSLGTAVYLWWFTNNWREYFHYRRTAQQD